MAFDASGSAGGSMPKTVTHERVRVFLSACDLISHDLRSKSDPFVVVYLKDMRTGDTFKEVGRTEVIMDQHFPKFTKHFEFDYYFEEEQTLKLDVYDEDKKGSSRLTDHDLLGTCSVKIGEVIYAESQTLKKRILLKGRPVKNKKSKKFSSMIIHAEQINEEGNQRVSLKLSASKLPKMDFFGGCDPYLEIWRVKPGTVNGKGTLVHKTEVIKKSKDPKWKIIETDLQLLCHCDKTQKVIFQVFDWDSDGSSDFIGQVIVSIEDVLRGFATRKLNNPSKKKKKDIGSLALMTTCHHSFLDFMSGGLDMSLTIGVDFTGSNLHPSNPRSLHHMSALKPSPYQVAIRTIGSIVSVYDSDQSYPTYGFGAKVGGTVSHCFPLNFNDRDPEVKGMSGVEGAYIAALPKVQLYGPTWAAPLLRKAIEQARSQHEQFRKGTTPHLQYSILLMLTDGAIMDFDATKDCIVEISNSFLPLSIIIVGIANPPANHDEAMKQQKEWAAMEALDADSEPLVNSRGNKALRDVVQFVKLVDFIKSDGIHYAQLSKETLAEVPKQFLSYAEYHKFVPPPRVDGLRTLTEYDMSEDDLRSDTMMPDTLGARPSDIPVMTGPEPPLPQGWEKTYDESGQPLYIDHNTQTSHWVHPTIQAAMDSKGAGTTATAAVATTTAVSAAPSTGVAPTMGTAASAPMFGAPTGMATAPAATSPTAASGGVSGMGMGGGMMGGGMAPMYGTGAPVSGGTAAPMMGGGMAPMYGSGSPTGGTGTAPMMMGGGMGAPMMGGMAPMGGAPYMGGGMAPMGGAPAYGGVAPGYGAPAGGAPYMGGGAPMMGAGMGAPMMGGTAPMMGGTTYTGGAPATSYTGGSTYQPPPSGGAGGAGQSWGV